MNEIALARSSDLDALLPLVAEYYAFDDIAHDAGSVRRALRELLDNDSLGQAWLVRSEGDVAGYVLLTYGFDLEFGGRQATVTELYLRPHVRRRGLGASALRTIEAHLADRGIAAYELQVERDNVDARAFYERNGFIAHDRIPLSKRVVPRSLARDTVDHLSLGVSDLASSKRFYDAALAPLGFTPHQDIATEVGYFRDRDTDHQESFALFIGLQADVRPSAGFHVAFRAERRTAVVEFYVASLATGGSDDGPPGLRPEYHRSYFGAFVLDPDGHRIEAVCHRPDDD